MQKLGFVFWYPSKLFTCMSIEKDKMQKKKLDLNLKKMQNEVYGFCLLIIYPNNVG